MIGVNGPAVVADDLSVAYGGTSVTEPFRAVDGVTFTVRRGEILAILGASGSGKSTLAAAIAGRLRAGRDGESSRRRRIVGGELTVLGQRVRGLRAGSRRAAALVGSVGYLPQDGAERLSPYLTVGEAIAEPVYARDRRFDQRAAGLMVARLVDAVQLPLGMIERNTWELSSGQRQRVALARSLVLEPQLLVADEPARGVDALVRESVLEVLATLQRERGFTVIAVSSDLREARALADRLAVLSDGHLVGIGPFDEVLDRPVDPYVRRLATTAGRQTKRRSSRAPGAATGSPRRSVTTGKSGA